MKKQPVPPPVADINVTPMVDVMLVLLIIFIVITPMLNKGITVDMAKTKNNINMTDADKEDAVLVAVSRDGRTYLGTDSMTPAELPTRVKDLLTTQQNKTVYVRSDARAKYEVVMEVIDNLRTAGVDQVGLLTEQIQQESSRPAEAAMPPAAD